MITIDHGTHQTYTVTRPTVCGTTSLLHTANTTVTGPVWVNVGVASNAVTQLSVGALAGGGTGGNPHFQAPARRSTLNRYLNASDLVEEFIKFCGTERVTKAEFLKLPMKLFMMWLVLEAAKDDDLEPPADIIQKLDKELQALIPSDPGDQEGDRHQEHGGQHGDVDCEVAAHGI